MSRQEIVVATALTVAAAVSVIAALVSDRLSTTEVGADVPTRTATDRSS